MKLSTGKSVVPAMILAGGMLFVGCSSAPVSQDGSASEQQSMVAKSTFIDSDVLPVGDSPILGNVNAPITIIDFSSLQCPYCARGNETLKLLLEKYPQEVRIVSKSFPLGFQMQSRPAAKAALAAGEQGKYWEMRELLFANMASFRGADMGALTAELAGQLGLDVERFVQDFQNPAYDAKILEDLELGASLGVQGTPHYFVNGVRVSGAQPFRMFDAIINHLLLEAEEMVESGVSRDALYSEFVKKYYEPIGPPEDELAANAPLKLGPDDLKIGDSYTKGPQDAPITIYEFSSFQCPFCKKGAGTLDELMKMYPGKIKLVYKNFPLSFQAQSEPAGRAALAAGRQGKFWEMYELIYENQTSLAEDGIFEKLAEKAGLDMKAFEKDMKDPAIAQQVVREQAEGEKIGVQGTPAFYINGTRLVGAQPIEKFKELIDAELAGE